MGSVRARTLGAILLAVGLLVGSAPRGLNAQASDLAKIRAAFPGGIGERIVEVIREAGRDGLPTDPLVKKALEGSAKRAPSGQVVKAITSYAAELREARSLIGKSAGEEDLVQVAEALRRGIGGSTIRSLARSRSGNLAMLLLVLGDLREEGVPAQAARSLVEDAASSGYRGQRLLSLSASVRGLIRKGKLRPTDAADSVRKELRGKR